MTPEERDNVIDNVAAEIYEIVRIELDARGIVAGRYFRYAKATARRRLRNNTEVLLVKMGVIEAEPKAGPEAVVDDEG